MLTSLAIPRFAAADPKGDINAKVKEAMDSYDLMDYDAAKKALNQAVGVAKKNKLEKSQLLAKVYLDIGIVAFAVPDKDAAKAAFAQAVALDPKIQIDAAYKSADMAKLLDEVRKKGGGGHAPAGDDGDDISAIINGGGGGDSDKDCSSVKGLQHNILDTSKSNSPAQIEAFVGSDLKAAKVSLQYRPEGGEKFTEIQLTKSGCKYTGSIPASATKGSVVHYYVAAYDGEGKVIAAKGSAGSPNIIELSGGGGSKGGGDEEDPLGAQKHGGGGGGGSVDDSTSVSATADDNSDKPATKKVWLTVAVGTGGGYVTGTTENGAAVKNCCIGESAVALTPELDISTSAQTQIGVAARIGLPLGANIPGHSPIAPAGLLRLRHSLSESGDGIRVMGQLGFGILRNTLKLSDGASGMDTDIVAQGPLLIGAGIGYSKHLGNSVMFIADLSALGAIAVTSSLGSAPALNSGVSADFSLGLAFGL